MPIVEIPGSFPANVGEVLGDRLQTVIEIRDAWGDDWQDAPYLRLVSALASVSPHSPGEAEFEYDYGRVRFPHESSASDRLPLEMLNWWVRVSLIGEGATQVDQGASAPTVRHILWVGRFIGTPTVPQGALDVPTGEQTLIAREASDILAKVSVHKSFWDDGSDGAELVGITVPFNRTSRDNSFHPNRSDGKATDGAFTFSEDGNVWTAHNAVEYVIVSFLNPNSDIEWKLGGQDHLLTSITADIQVAESDTVLGVLQKLINPLWGISFLTRYWEDGLTGEEGFEVVVFSTTDEPVSFAGVELPANPDAIDITITDSDHGLQVVVDESSDQQYSEIRFLGRRAVTCVSSIAVPASKIWTSDMEAAYLAGAGETGTDQDLVRRNDEARASDQFAAVFSGFYFEQNYDPKFDGEGNVVQGDTTTATENFDRSTLPWIPLREGEYVISGDLIDAFPDGVQRDYMSPQAFLLNHDTGRYVNAEQVDGVSISVVPLQSRLGMVVRATPNHIMALNWWSGANPTLTQPRFDYEETMLTYAFETTIRNGYVWSDSTDPLREDGILTIIDNNLETWMIAPGAATGIHPATGGLYDSGGSFTVIRNDFADSRQALRMCGLIAQHGKPHASATITKIGRLEPWTGHLGKIIRTVQTGGVLKQIHAPITSVTYDTRQPPRGDPMREAPRVVIRAGFMR